MVINGRLTNRWLTCLIKGILVFRHTVLNKAWELGLVVSLRLTHLPLVPHICVSDSGQHWFRWWLVAYSAPSHYLNKLGVIASGPSGTNYNDIFIKIQNVSFTKMENASENIVCEMVAIFFKCVCVCGHNCVAYRWKAGIDWIHVHLHITFINIINGELVAS